MKLLDGKHIVLASNSPRRKELLKGLELDFEVRILQDIDESYPDSLQGEEIPKYISLQKARAYLPTVNQTKFLLQAIPLFILMVEYWVNQKMKMMLSIC